jgi:hypothetical protein
VAGRYSQKATALIVGLEERPHFGAQLRVVTAGFVEIGGALGRLPLQCLGEEFLDSIPVAT